MKSQPTVGASKRNSPQRTQRNRKVKDSIKKLIDESTERGKEATFS